VPSASELRHGAPVGGADGLDDEGAGLGEVGDGLAEVGDGLGEEGDGLAEVGDELAEVGGELGDVGAELGEEGGADDGLVLAGTGLGLAGTGLLGSGLLGSGLALVGTEAGLVDGADVVTVGLGLGCPSPRGSRQWIRRDPRVQVAALSRATLVIQPLCRQPWKAAGVSVLVPVTLGLGSVEPIGSRHSTCTDPLWQVTALSRVTPVIRLLDRQP
jgi:hypothetical protein